MVRFRAFRAPLSAVELKRDYFITQSETLHCAASINSLADVTVHLIEQLLDRATAQHVERNFSHEIRRSYAEHHYLDGGAGASPDELVVEAETWIAENLTRQLALTALAAHLGVAVRTLERRFRAATGTSPRAYWQRQRVLAAKDLLLKTNLAVAEIAWRVGYQDAGYFTRLFRREMLLTPTAYRETVRPKLFRASATAVAPVKEIDTRRGGKRLA